MRYSVLDIVQDAMNILDSRFADSSQRHEQQSLLVNLLEIVSTNLAAKIPLVEREELKTDSNGDISFSLFDHDLTKVLSVTVDGVSMTGEMLVDRISLKRPRCKVSVVYTYSPKRLTLDGMTEYSPAVVPRSVLVLFVVSMYKNSIGDFESAKIYEQMAEKQLQTSSVRKSDVKIPARTFA